MFKEIIIFPFDYSKGKDEDKSLSSGYITELFASIPSQVGVSDNEDVALYNIDEPVTIMFYYKKYGWLLDFLSRKQCRILRKYPHNEKNERSYEESPIKRPLILDDFGKNVFNFSKNYEYTSEFLERLFNYSLDIKTCKTVLKEIEEKKKMLIELF